ncbi:carbohydrate kinase family protein [Paenibacillus daejeonensis]|uniref:carbohydrate kinase family protein n=1 Tax=Paenibacillus daejeonensis TaxID=135193 RepID=UPI00037FAA7D|nr:sugar kinase [Paenibacillus daejeonensis]
MLNFEDRLAFDERSLDLLTIGDMLIDMISTEYDENVDCDTYSRFFGGSPANIAMNTKKLGIRSLVASAVGDDGLGTFLIKHLHRAGMDTRCIQKVDYSTSMVVVTKSQSTPVPIFYRGADYHLAYTEELREALQAAKIVHFSCWPLSMMPVRRTTERVLHEARQAGTLIGFDPNYHPMIWQKGEDGVAYVKSIISQVDIVKPSEDDAERLFGKDTHENQLQKFLDLGAKMVIMTLGKEGAIASNGQETVRFDTLAEEVVDTTGAGDAFWSGFYAGIIEGASLREAMNLGFAVSAYKLRYTGAVVELPELEDIRTMYGLQEVRA